MKPVGEVRQETAEVLGRAVAEVAKRAIKPELEPFESLLKTLATTLERYVEELSDQIRSEKKALDQVNKNLGEVVAAGRNQAAAVSQAQGEVRALRARLEGLTSELANTREAQSTSVVAINALRDEISSWMGTSQEHSARLDTVVEQASTLAASLASQASNFESFKSDLAVRIDLDIQQVLGQIKESRNVSSQALGAMQEASDGRLAALEASFKSVTDEISSRQEDHRRSLTKTAAQMTLLIRIVLAFGVFAAAALALSMLGLMPGGTP